jgi:hypothetical protein
MRRHSLSTRYIEQISYNGFHRKLPIQRFAMIVEARGFMPNTVFQKNLQTLTVIAEIRHYSSQYSARLSVQLNGLVMNLLAELDIKKRLLKHQSNDLPTISFV